MYENRWKSQFTVIACWWSSYIIVFIINSEAFLTDSLILNTDFHQLRCRGCCAADEAKECRCCSVGPTKHTHLSYQTLVTQRTRTYSGTLFFSLSHTHTHKYAFTPLILPIHLLFLEWIIILEDAIDALVRFIYLQSSSVHELSQTWAHHLTALDLICSNICTWNTFCSVQVAAEQRLRVCQRADGAAASGRSNR